MIQKTTFAIILWLSVINSSYGQSTSGFDFRKAEQAIESVMIQRIDDPETQEKACVIASLVGVYQFNDHRYADAIRSLEYAIGKSRKSNETITIQNYVFLIHALCMEHNREALARLRELTPMLQELQENSLRGDFILEYADGMRNVMNSVLLPLTSLVSKTFPDKESLDYCFNLMLFLKQFSFYQLGHKTEEDIKHSLFIDYRKILSESLKKDEVAIEFVPCMEIDGNQVRGTTYVAYILKNDGSLQLVEVSNKRDIEALFHHNDTPWMLYDADHATPLRAIAWDSLKPFVNRKKKIFLTPCGILNRINFLLFDSRIRELTSSCELIKPYSESHQHTAVLIGDIDYDHNAYDTTRGDRDWGKLKGTKEEIESIGRSLSPSFSVTKLTKDSVSERAVRQLCLSSPRILHFATHAICYTDSDSRKQYPYFRFPYSYLPEKPELTFTGLVLAGGNQGFKRIGNLPMDNDGILLSEEISKFNLNGTMLAVLSACDSGNGVFDDIEGTLGLIKAFKLAGVKTIIASLSKIDDDSAAEFMSDFYRRLMLDGNIHAAFAETINAMRFKHPTQPKSWAVFKLIDYKD